jgi:hypothetical protein
VSAQRISGWATLTDAEYMNGGSRRDPVEEGTTGFRCDRCGELIQLTIVDGRVEITRLDDFLLLHRECLTQTPALGA